MKRLFSRDNFWALALALIIMCLTAPALAQSPTVQAWRLAVGFVPASALTAR